MLNKPLWNKQLTNFQKEFLKFNNYYSMIRIPFCNIEKKCTAFFAASTAFFNWDSPWGLNCERMLQASMALRSGLK